MIKKIRKVISPRNVLLFIFFLSCLGFMYLFSLLHPNSRRIKSGHLPSAPECSRRHMINNQFHNHLPNQNERFKTRQKVLIFLREGRNRIGRDIVELVESVRFKYHAHSGNIRSLPVLIDDDKGRYSIIIFEDMSIYLTLNQWNREMIDKYCLDYNVGLIFFTHPVKGSKSEQTFHHVGDFPLKFASASALKNYELNPAATLLRIARAGEVWNKCLENDWVVFETFHSTYIPVSYAVHDSSDEFPKCDKKSKLKKKHRSRRSRSVFEFFDTSNDDNDAPSNDIEGNKRSNSLITVVQDTGELDGIQRVYFGSGLRFWLHKVLLLDSISYLSRGRLVVPMERYIQIDIDDIFVGVVGTRMTADDVKALIAFQEELRKSIPGFTYQLGFSGKFFNFGNAKEKEGDELFLKNHQQFFWFPHMWSHMQAHWFNNATKLCDYMEISRQFALRWNFNTSSRYAVAPHHAGVFPVHEQLYECWNRVWNISYTSTEEYPHLRPDRKRRGFIYRGVKVLPRQTCGLFTHTMLLHLYPEGPEVLHSIINGGSLFLSFLYNQFNVFMTHMTNYGNDRLGLYTFDRAIRFVQCWTNLRLRYVEPAVMAEKYFQLYPDEADPIWLNPCLDKRHFEIWSEEKSCSRLPNFVVVGPQKTGTTALYWYLNMHPSVQSNKPSETTFEEIQFFNGPNYLKGLDWYMDFFPTPSNATVMFEKSANYFDQSIVPKRLGALLPHSHVVIILIEPGKRAYSWYQHQRSHGDETANQYSFNEVIRAHRKGSPPALISLQRRCLDPGFYADHLETWLEHISSSMIVIVDGELLRSNPVQVMNDLQSTLGFPKFLDYSKQLQFDEKKGFFCQLLDTGKTKCLGAGKGRKYPVMDEDSSAFLEKYYAESNRKLVRVLKAKNKSLPEWLNEL